LRGRTDNYSTILSSIFGGTYGKNKIEELSIKLAKLSRKWPSLLRKMFKNISWQNGAPPGTPPKHLGLVVSSFVLVFLVQ
jgi:hypothetical protein